MGQSWEKCKMCGNRQAVCQIHGGKSVNLIGAGIAIREAGALRVTSAVKLLPLSCASFQSRVLGWPKRMRGPFHKIL